MDLQRVDVVLVRPSRPANVAAACRALKNMGISSLSLVGPPPGLDTWDVRALAYGAWDVLDAARVAPSLSEAVAAATLVAGTSGRESPGTWTPRRLAEEAAPRLGGGRLALVFGPEASGLTNDELALCHVRVHISCAPEHPSLNLAQAVLILAYELRSAAASPFVASGEPRATAGDVEEAMQELRRGLQGIGYLNPDNPDAVLAELRALVVRADPTAREAALLRGLARQVRWAADRIAVAPAGADNRAPRKEPS